MEREYHVGDNVEIPYRNSMLRGVLTGICDKDEGREGYFEINNIGHFFNEFIGIEPRSTNCDFAIWVMNGASLKDQKEVRSYKDLS